MNEYLTFRKMITPVVIQVVFWLGALAFVIGGIGTMFAAFFTQNQVRDWASVKTSDTTLFARYFREMLSHGIYLAPSQFEAGFISSAHDSTAIDQTIAAAQEAFKRI